MSLKNNTKVLISSLLVVFVLSLGLHNHVFYFGSSYSDGVFNAEQGLSGHNGGFCSACRLNGNLKQTHEIKKPVFDKFGFLIGLIDNNLLIPSSAFQFNKSPRSPPTS